MNLKEEIDLLVRQNDVLVQTLSVMGIRLDNSLKLLSAISSLSAVPVLHHALTDAARAIAEILVRDTSDIDACSLLIHDPKTDMLKLLAARGQADLLGEIVGGYNTRLAFAPGEGVAGRVFLRNEPYFSHRGSDEYTALIERTGLTLPESLACMPLCHRDQPIGVLNVSFSTAHPFDNARRRDLLLLAGVVANLVQTFFLKEELNEKARFLQETVGALRHEIGERKTAQAELARARADLEQRVEKRTADLALANQALTREIGERRRTSDKLEKSEQQYRALFESISDLIYTHDAEGRILSANPAVGRSLGRPLESLAGALLTDLMNPVHRPAFRDDYLDQVLGQGRAQGIFILMDHEGGSRYIEYSAARIETADGVPYVTGSGRDVTERHLAQKELKTLQDQLAQSQKMQAIGTLASGIAHDFNNFLQAISGYIQFLLTETHSPETARAYLQSADEAVVGAAELVRRLLTFSRKLEPDPRPLDLNQQVIRSIRLIERTIPRMIGIETYLAPDLWSIHGDPQQAEQVLINLCTNARDAMPEGGRLTVETANVLLDEEYARNFLDVTPGRYVRVRVTDTGVGMDENTRRQMFEPFFTTKPVGEGTGLGLFTVYGIVKGHGGHIAVQSEPGRGASFLIHFPACAEANADTQYPRKHLEAAPGGHETILVVDDEKAILDVVENVLARHGYQVLTAEGGEKALDLYRGLGYRVDLVILDLGMPGMGGYGCLKKLLGMAPQAKVLIASGYATDEHRRQSLAYGAKGFIGKPYRITELLKRIRVVLDA